MEQDTFLVALLGGLHLLGLGFAGLMLLPLLRDEPVLPSASPGEDDGGEGGGSDRLGPAAPSDPRGGGLPLPDAVPARVRVREGQRLADLLPASERRPSHAPVPMPARTPAER